MQAHMVAMWNRIKDYIAEQRMRESGGPWRPLLEEGQGLRQRRDETEELLRRRGVKHDDVARRLENIIRGPYKRYDGFEEELYSHRKPLKAWTYARMLLQEKDRCPWHGELQMVRLYTIRRPLTEREERNRDNYMLLSQILPMYETINGEFDEEHHDERERQEYRSFKLLYENLLAQQRGTEVMHFTDLLPHLVREHHFFPSGSTYRVDVPFLLEALGYQHKG